MLRRCRAHTLPRSIHSLRSAGNESSDGPLIATHGGRVSAESAGAAAETSGRERAAAPFEGAAARLSPLRAASGAKHIAQQTERGSRHDARGRRDSPFRTPPRLASEPETEVFAAAAAVLDDGALDASEDASKQTACSNRQMAAVVHASPWLLFRWYHPQGDTDARKQVISHRRPRIPPPAPDEKAQPAECRSAGGTDGGALHSSAPSRPRVNAELRRYLVTRDIPRRRIQRSHAFLTR